MNTQHIQHFLAAVRLGSLARAAVSLNVSQPALTKSVKRLEDEFGAKLFTRVPRGVVPTEAARALIPHMEAMVGELASARRKIGSLRGGRIGHVSIAAGPSVARVLVMPAIAAFARTNPEISIRLIEGSEGRVGEALARAEADFAVIAQTSTLAESGYLVEKLFDDRLVLYSTDPALKARTRIAAQRLGTLGMIAMESGDGLQEYISRCIAAAGHALPTPRITVNSLALLTDYLSLPGVSAILPAAFQAIARRAAGAPLKVLAFADVDFAWPVSIYSRPGGLRSPAAAAIALEVRKMAARQAARLAP